MHLFKWFLWAFTGCPMHLAGISAGAAAAIAAGVGAAASGAIQAGAAGDAADAQAKAAGAASAAVQIGAERSNALADLGYTRQQDYLNNALTQSRGDLQPYSSAGQFALNQLLGGLDTEKQYIAPQSKEIQDKYKTSAGNYTKQLTTVMDQIAELKAKQAKAQKDPEGQYLRDNPDVAKNWKNPTYTHFQMYGNKEGRGWAGSQYDDMIAALEKKAKIYSNQYDKLNSAYQKSLGQGAKPQGELMRSFTAQDFRNDPTSGGKAPPDLLKNFTMQDFEADPGYQFRMDEGNKAINNSAAAQGGLLSGATLKAIQKYSQNLGSQEYQNAFNRFGTNRQNAANVYQNSYERFNNNANLKYNRLMGILAPGQNAATNQAGFSQNTGNNLANAAYNNAALKGGNIMNAAGADAEYKTQAGNAQAAGIIGQGNAYSGIASSLGNIGSNYLSGYGAQQSANNYNPNYGGGGSTYYGGYAANNNAYSNALTPKFQSGNY